MMPDSDRLAQTPQGKVGLAFAQALVRGDFMAARQLLSPQLQAEYSGDQLQRTYLDMIEYGGEIPTEIEVMNILEDWKGKAPEDLGWAYVSIACDSYGEAVAVVVGNDMLISDLEWGRP